MKLVIKQHRPGQRFALLLGACAVLIAAVAIAFHYGHWQSIAHAMGAVDSRSDIMDDYLQLRRENKRVVAELADMKHTAEIDDHARVDYQNAISGLQSEIADLKLEVAFYRDILSATEAEKGPHVRGFKLRDFGGSRRFQYRLVLTHVNKSDKVADGRVDVEIQGLRDGYRLRLPLSNLAEPDSTDLAFTFKHFRRIEGVFQLPNNFVPEKVHVAVFESGRKKSSFQKIYNWEKLIN